MNHINNIWLNNLNPKFNKRLEIVSRERLFFLKIKHQKLILNNYLFLKLISYNTRNGLKTKTLHLFLKMVQVYFKMFKVMARRRKRRIKRIVFFKNFEKYFQRMLTIKQLFLNKKLVRKKGRHKKYDYKFVVLYKNKRLSHLLSWLRSLSYVYESRKYLTRLLYIYFDFLFFVKKSYVYKLHRSLRKEHYIQKKKKHRLFFSIKKRSYLGSII